jgi:GTP-binding protein HflX
LGRLNSWHTEEPDIIRKGRSSKTVSTVEAREPRRSELSVRRERVVLAGVILPGMHDEHEGPLAELTRLTDTAGARIVGELVQKLKTVGPTSFLGKGKAERLRELLDAVDADTVIFDNDLTPAQIRNLERILDRKVLDRSELILDIFASRARTHQARLQVELAQLEYTMPRLQRMWTHLERYEGGIGMRGPGERQIETDRRLARRRKSILKKELEQITARKEREVKSRVGEFTASLVGYTNAGKSTLMNALTGSRRFVEDKLFATLDTCTRAWRIDDHHKVLLSDTVGFIRRLPHHLIASFHATLEEATHADLLLHVVDAAHPDCEGQVRAAQDVLKEIGCADKPTVMVLNKIDVLEELSSLALLRREYPDSVEVSAITGEGLERLSACVAGVLNNREIQIQVNTHCGNGKLMAFLAENGEVLEQEFAGDSVWIRATIQPRHLGRVKRLAPRAVKVG